MALKPTKKTGSSFKYVARSRGEMQKRAVQSGSSREGFIKDGFEVWTPKEGDHRVRILPPTWEKPDHYGLDVYGHYNVGLEGSNYICLAKPPAGYKPQECPCCEERERSQRMGEEEVAQSLRANKRVMVWCIVRAEAEKGPQIWPMPYTLDKELASLSVDPDNADGVYAIDSPDEGYDIFFKREGKDTRTKYTSTRIARKPSPISSDEDEQEEWLAKIEANPLPDCMLMAEPEKILSELAGGVRLRKKDGEDDEDPRAKKGSRGKAPPRGRGAQDEEEAEPEEKPARRRGKRMAAPADYDELADLSEDDMIELADAQDIDLNDRRPIIDQLAKAFGLEKPARKATRSVVEEEPDPDDDPPPKARAKMKRAVVEEEPDPDDDPPPRARRTPAVDPDDDPPPRARRAKVVEEEPDPDEVDPDDDPPPRARRAKVVEEEPDPDDDPPVKPKRGRPPGKKVVAEEPEPDPDDDPPPRKDREGARTSKLRDKLSGLKKG